MRIKIIKKIFSAVFWQLFIDTLISYDYKLLILNFTVHLQTKPSRNILLIFWDLLRNNLTDNVVFRTIGLS